MRVLKQVMTVQFNDRCSLGAWDGGAEYDGASGTISLTLQSVSPDRAIAVLEAIEAAVASAHGGPGGQLRSETKAVSTDPKEVQCAVEADIGDQQRALAKNLVLDLAYGLGMHHVREVAAAADETAADAEKLVEDLKPAPPAASGSAAALSGGDIASKIDKAAHELHAANGTLALGKFVQICAQHDPEVQAEIAASIGGDKCVATKAHTDRNARYFASYTNRDDAARTARLLNTMRSIASAMPPS